MIKKLLAVMMLGLPVFGAFAQPAVKPAKVYFTSEITPEGLLAVYKALGVTPEGKVAVKISTGESSQSNHLSPELIGKLVEDVKGTLVECNTAYGGNRSNTADHRRAIEWIWQDCSGGYNGRGGQYGAPDAGYQVFC